MAALLENMTSKPKRKNDDKRKGRPRHTLLTAVTAALALVLIAAGVFLSRSRFTPMSDVPRDDLVYAEGDEAYTLDFQTGSRTSSQLGSQPIDSKETSPDGRWEIRFEWVEYTVSSLVLEDLNGEEPKRTFGKFYDAGNTLSWSPDQQWVAFSANDSALDTRQAGHAAEIWMVHIPTGDLKRLSDNAYLDRDPSFSPDGTQIVYMSSADGYPRVYVMDVASGESRLLTPNQYGDNPKWSPDGQWIAFEAWYQVKTPTPETNRIKIFIVRVDGAHLQPIAFGKIGYGYLLGWETE